MAKDLPINRANSVITTSSVTINLASNAIINSVTIATTVREAEAGIPSRRARGVLTIPISRPTTNSSAGRGPNVRSATSTVGTGINSSKAVRAIRVRADMAVKVKAMGRDNNKAIGRINRNAGPMKRSRTILTGPIPRVPPETDLMGTTGPPTGHNPGPEAAMAEATSPMARRSLSKNPSSRKVPER